MNIVWEGKKEDDAPSQKMIRTIASLIEENRESIEESEKQKTGISLFVEIEGMFIQFGFTKDDYKNCIAEELSQDEWLDELNAKK